MQRKTTVVLLVVALAASILAGCSKPPAVPQEPKILNLPSMRAAATANIHLASLDADGEITDLITGTLYTWMPLADRSGAAVVPELAASDPVNTSGDGKVWKIALKKGAKWENGDPINADSFMYSWKMLLDPVMVNAQASQFADYFVGIKNAAAYFGQASSDPKVEIPWTDVGLKKLNDYTLEITLTGDFTAIELMRHLTFSRSGLVYQKIYEAQMNTDRTATQYGSSKETLLSSGPYKMVNWVKGAERVFEANPNYALADKVKLDGIVYRVIEDAGTRIQMFENGQIDYVTLDAEGVATYAEDPRLLPGSSRYVRQIEINQTHPDQPIFGNANFRKAMYYAIDRATIAKLSNTLPAPFIVPFTSVAYADGTLFRTLADKAGYIPKDNGYDPVLALKLFEQALKEENLTKVDFTLNYTTTVNDHVIIAEFLQESLPKIFGENRFHVELAGIPSPQSLDALKSSPTNPKAYEMIIGQWGLVAGDFAPNRIFEVYTTTYPRRNGPYRSDRMDALYAESVTDAVRKDEKKSAQLSMEMEKVFIEEVINVPVNQTTSTGMTADRLLLPLEEKHTTAGWCMKFADLKPTAVKK